MAMDFLIVDCAVTASLVFLTGWTVPYFRKETRLLPIRVKPDSKR